MPFFPSLGDEDKVPHALANFNIGIERPIIELHQILMRSDDSPFTVAQRELLAAFVSGTNACNYCVGAHTATAVEFGVEEELVSSLLRNVDTADIDENLRTREKIGAEHGVENRDAEKRRQQRERRAHQVLAVNHDDGGSEHQHREDPEDDLGGEGFHRF